MRADEENQMVVQLSKRHTDYEVIWDYLKSHLEHKMPANIRSGHLVYHVTIESFLSICFIQLTPILFL